MPDPADTIDLEEALRERLAVRQRAESTYDYLVTYSGGKDSSYIAHWLKHAPGGRVCLFTIDNDFHSEYARQRRIRNAQAMGCDLHVYHRHPDDFIAFYRFILRESAVLRQIAAQPLCGLCQAYMLGEATLFAAAHGIPVVAHGFTMEQFTYGRQGPTTPKEIDQLMLLNKLYLEKVKQAMTTLPAYQEEPRVRTMVDILCTRAAEVDVVFPLMWIPYNVEEIKALLQERYGWQNTLPNVSNEEYFISSCELGDLRGVLTRYLGHRDQIREILELDHQHGRITEKAYQRTLEILATEAGPEVTPRLGAMLNRLGVRDLFDEVP